jgi:hypothetical protein
MSIGDQIGAVTLSFISGSQQVVPLDVGVNIREQAIGTTAAAVINTFTSPSLQNVWQGNNNGGVLSAVDMLTIPVSGDQTLTSITVADESEALIGELNPALNLKGVTVESVPEPSTWAMLAMGGVGLILVCRRRKALIPLLLLAGLLPGSNLHAQIFVTNAAPNSTDGGIQP